MKSMPRFKRGLGHPCAALFGVHILLCLPTGPVVAGVCVQNDFNALQSMQAESAIIEFAKDCKETTCSIRAEIGHKRTIAQFTLDPRDSFGVCNEIRVVDELRALPNCANKYVLHYQSVRIKTEPHKEAAIVFEIAQAIGSDRQICSSPDENDGPALATFTAVYRVGPQTVIYVYELDNYPTIQESIEAKRKYLLGKGGK